MSNEREIRVRILGDSESAERAFKRTANASEKIGPSAKVAQNALDNVSAALTGRLGPASGVADDALKKMSGSAISSGNALGLGLAGGAAVAGGALAAFAADGVSKLVDLAGEVRNFQRTSGASAEDSSRFVAVLDDLGVSSEAGATALFKLGREVSAGAPKLAQYGIEVEKNADGSANLTETLLNVADAYSRAPDQATKTAIAFAAFGKQAQGLLPLLEKGRVGLDEFFKGAEQHGQILSQEDIDDARELELALDDLSDAMRGLQFIGAKALVPFLTTVAEVGTKAVGLVEKLNESTGGALKDLGTTVVAGFAGPIGSALTLFKNKSDESTDATKQLDEAVTAMGDAASRTASDQGELGEATDDATEAFKEFKTAADLALGSILGEREAAIALAEKVVALGESLAENGNQTGLATEKQRNLTSSLIDVVKAAEAEVDAITKSGQISTDAASQKAALIERLEQVKQKYPQLAGPIQEYINKIHSIPEAPVTTPQVITGPALKAVGELVDFIRSSLGNVLVTLPTASGTSIKARAHGGSSTGLTLVGEEGPELLNLGSTPHYVTDAGRTAGMLSGGGASTTNVYLTVEGSVVAEHDLVEAVASGLEARRRRNGPGNY